MNTNSHESTLLGRSLDMKDWMIIRDVAQGLREVRSGDFVSESILDILHDE
jgi:hypothetical protein